MMGSHPPLAAPTTGSRPHLRYTYELASHDGLSPLPAGIEYQQ
jgi:hypothetical protein